MSDELPEQHDLRRRLKAARVLRDLTIAALVERLPPASKMAERTLRKYESGENALRPPVLRELAAALDVPYAWFTAPDVMAPFTNGEQELHEIASFSARLAAIEAQLAAHMPDSLPAQELRAADDPADSEAQGSAERTTQSRRGSRRPSKRQSGARRAPGETSPQE